MIKSRLQQYFLFIAAILIFGMAFGLPAAEAEWVPKKPVSFVCPYKPGGGTDTVARALTAVVNDNNLSPAPWVVQNRTGGGGLVALKYLIDRPGDKHTIKMMTSSAMTSAMLQGGGLSWKKLTPIANLILDVEYLATHTKSGFKTAKEVIEFAKENPRKLRVGGAHIGNNDHLVTLMLEKEGNLKVTYVAFSGGGAARKNLLGGHLHTAWLNPSEMEGLLVKDGGTIFPLAVAWETRQADYPDIPTLKELGYNVVYDSFFRGVMGAPGISADVVAFYDGVIAKATKHPDWLKALKKKKMPAYHIPEKEFKASLERWDAKLSEFIEMAKAIK